MRGLRQAIDRVRGGRTAAGGYSFVELLIVTVILLVLASAVLPLAQMSTQRQREAELRRALREMRTAIDAFKDAADRGIIASTELEPGSQNYPPSLDVLVEGVPAAGDASGQVLRFLRRVPVDPMTGDDDWGLRAYQDDPDSTFWGGGNVYDVYSRSRGVGIDGTEYRQW